MYFYAVIQRSSAAVFIKRSSRIKPRKIQKDWWKQGWRNHCGSDSAGRGEEKSPNALTLCFAFYPVIWVSVCGLFVAESMPSLSVNLMVPCSQGVAHKPIWLAGPDCHWYESAMLQWNYAIYPLLKFLIFLIFSLRKIDLCAKFQLYITRTTFLALQKNAK